MLLSGFRFAEANEAKKEQLIYETMAAEALQRQNRMARNNYRLKRKVVAMKRDKNVEYSYRYLYERVLWLFGLTGRMQTQWHKDYVGAFEIVERMKKTLELKGSDFGVEDVKLPLFLEVVLRGDKPLVDSRVKGGFTGLTWNEYKQLSDFLDNVYVAGRDAFCTSVCPCILSIAHPTILLVATSITPHKYILVRKHFSSVMSEHHNWLATFTANLSFTRFSS